jgi:hypothetical protein
MNNDQNSLLEIISWYILAIRKEFLYDFDIGVCILIHPYVKGI